MAITFLTKVAGILYTCVMEDPKPGTPQRFTLTNLLDQPATELIESMSEEDREQILEDGHIMRSAEYYHQ